jgi:protein disulfide-isomerase A1
LALFLAVLAISSVFAHGDHDHDHDHDEEEEAAAGPTEVLVLDENNFEASIKKNDLTLVEFYAPWCGHCKALAPEYDRASILLKGTAGVALAKVDCTEQRDLCEKYEVQGFPTLKLFRNDDSAPSEFDQARKADAIVKFMQKQKKAAFEIIKNAEDAKKFADIDSVKVSGVFAADDKNKIEVFVAVAKALRNEYDFAYTTEAGLLEGVATGSAILHRNFDEPKVTYNGDFTEELLTSFIKSNAFPLVGEIGPENYQKYVERGFPLVWIFIDKNDQATLNVAREVAKDFKTSLSFVWLDGERWAEHAKTFGLSGKPPGVVIEDRDARKNYVFKQDQAVTAEKLKAHAQGFLDKTLSATVRSEEIPEKNDGPVFVLVGKNFEQVVMDTNKDVMVEFYAPWCGHCKTLAPKYDKLGASFKSSPSIVIAKIDATENDTPVDIRGFPTIMFWPANDKANPVTYEGERTEGAMAKWIKANAHTLKGKTESKSEAPAADKTKDEL